MDQIVDLRRLTFSIDDTNGSPLVNVNITKAGQSYRVEALGLVTAATIHKPVLDWLLNQIERANVRSWRQAYSGTQHPELGNWKLRIQTAEGATLASHGIGNKPEGFDHLVASFDRLITELRR